MLADNSGRGPPAIPAPNSSCTVLAGAKWNPAMAEYEMAPRYLTNVELQAEVADGLIPRVSPEDGTSRRCKKPARCFVSCRIGQQCEGERDCKIDESWHALGGGIW